jgi:hypothetical protein
MVRFYPALSPLDTAAPKPDISGTAPWSASSSIRTPAMAADPALAVKPQEKMYSGLNFSRQRARERFPVRGSTVPDEQVKPGDTGIASFTNRLVRAFGGMPFASEGSYQPTGPGVLKRRFPARAGGPPVSSKTSDPARLINATPPKIDATKFTFPGYSPDPVSATAGPGSTPQAGIFGSGWMGYVAVGALVLFGAAFATHGIKVGRIF